MNVGERIPTDGNRGVRILLVAAVVASLSLDWRSPGSGLRGFPPSDACSSTSWATTWWPARCGMQVTEFFVGFGPRLWSFRRGETEYGIKVIPGWGLCSDYRHEQPRDR